MPRTLSVLSLLLLSALHTPLALAQAPVEEPCRDDQSLDLMSVCYSAAHLAEDARLNEIWRKLLRQYQEFDMGIGEIQDNPYPPTAEALRASQRAWIAWRDAECIAQVSIWTNGSQARVAMPACQYSLTKNRADHLQSLLAEQ